MTNPAGDPRAASGGSDEFRSTERFEIRRRLGRGGYGVVYEVYDRHRRMAVALKTLHRQEVSALARLKQEFRTLAEISHPNLVSFYELLFDGTYWCITMELIDGVDFLRYVRPGTLRPEDLDESTVEMATRTLVPPAFNASGDQTPVDLGKLRASLLQLAQGLAFLHAQGKLHRDIKTSNVLVTPVGRVVLLDFGLATELVRVEPESTQVTGTVAYMAPEQSVNQGVSPASDWYGFGVMLFEALTGRLPFAGDGLSVLRAKREGDAPEPRSLWPVVPDDLNDLCRALMARDPEARPTGVEVLARLQARTPWSSEVGPAPPSGSDSPFVGRREPLTALRDAFEASTLGRSVTVYVHGSSGIGKTSLVREFLQELAGADREVVILAGRCYERESVPYKALDSLIDALSRYLARLPAEDARALIPRDIVALARLFPVLNSVPSVARARQRIGPVPESQEARRRAFAALRELFGRLSDRHPVVLSIDDLQWGDADSSALLAHLVEPPDAPAMLLVASYRSEEAANVPLRDLVAHHARPTPTGDAREIALGGLPAEEAAELARTLARPGDAALASETVLRECHGNPFFISELVRHLEMGTASTGMAAIHDGGSTRRVTLDAVLQARIDAVSAEGRRLLEVLAVAGGPLQLDVAGAASHLASREIGFVANLRSLRLIRVRLVGSREQLEIYHDRIRGALRGRLSAEAVRAIHAELARAMEASDVLDPEILATHFHGAGDLQRAARYARQAAQAAMEALAFDRAARLYQLVLAWGPAEEHPRGQTYERLGEALANAGRGRASAEAYLEAAALSTGDARLEHKRRAGEQFLRSGHLDAGFRAMREVLDAVGLKLARTPGEALLQLLWGRWRLRLSGLRFRERPASEIPSRERLLIDTCWSVAMHIGTVDHFRGAALQAKHLRLALRAGDPYRVARAVAIEVAYSSTSGPGTVARTRALSDLADRMARRIDDSQMYALVALVKGMAAYMQGAWRPALQWCDQAESLLRERQSGIAWELDTVHLYALLSLFYLGELFEFRRRMPIVLKEAQERDDLTAQTNLRVRLAYLASLLRDDVEEARGEVAEGIRRWSRDGFHAQHYFEMFAQTEIALYAGQPAVAWECVTRAWSPLRRSLLLRVQPVFIEAHSLRGRSAIAAAEAAPPSDRARLVRAAERDAARLARTGTAWARAAALVIGAGIAALRQDDRLTDERLQAAERMWQDAGMPLHAAAVRWQRGGRSGGAEPADARDWFARQDVRRPDRLAALIAPGVGRPAPLAKKLQI